MLKIMESNLGKCCEKALHNETICTSCKEINQLYKTSMDKTQIKPGPKPFYNLTVDVEFTLDPLKVSSFKSMVSKMNKGKSTAEKMRFSYDTKGRKVIATRLLPASPNN